MDSTFTLMFLYCFIFHLEFNVGICYIVGAYVLPHGGIALDPSNFNTTNATALLQAKELHRGCLKVGQAIRDTKPDIIVLSTPHGLADYRNFLIYMNSQASGYGTFDDCLHLPCRYNMSLSLDTKLSSIIIGTFGYERNVSALSAFGPLGNDNQTPLRWGEVIPLYFTGDLTNHTRVVILSQPTRRYTDDVVMIPELLALGKDMFHILEDIPDRVAVVISSDLAHTHRADGPYGYSNTSQPFDDIFGKQPCVQDYKTFADVSKWYPVLHVSFETQVFYHPERNAVEKDWGWHSSAIGEWGRTLSSQSLLVTAAGLVDTALSCGYTGLVMLHGILSQELALWQPSVYVNLHPSYYGMMAAEFKRKSST